MASPPEIRSLSAADLERVVGIDLSITGRARRPFYRKRLGDPAGDGLLALGADAGGRLVGFVLAHVLDGEFGGTAPVGGVDALAVDPAARRTGTARALLASLERILKGRGVRELRTEVAWTEHDLVTFFSSAGFRLSPRIVLERGTDRLVEERADESGGGAEPAVTVRSMDERDVPALVRLDRKITGRDRTPYYARKAAEVLRQSGVRVSLVAERGGAFAGFVMARVDLGEFGRTEPTAVLDTIGVDPAFAGHGVGGALLAQLVLNLGSLRVERVVTQAAWDDLDLVAFLSRSGFERSQRLSFEKPVDV